MIPRLSVTNLLYLFYILLAYFSFDLYLDHLMNFETHSCPNASLPCPIACSYHHCMLVPPLYNTKVKIKGNLLHGLCGVFIHST